MIREITGYLLISKHHWRQHWITNDLTPPSSRLLPIILVNVKCILKIGSVILEPHMTSDLIFKLEYFHGFKGSDQLRVDNGNGLPIKHVGTSSLPTQLKIIPKNVLHGPSITKILLSMRRLG